MEPAWTPTAEIAERANLGAFLRERDLPSYARLHAWSIGDRAGFWGAAIDRLGIAFSRPPDAILDDALGPEAARWLPGALLNIADSCFAADPDRAAVVAAAEGAELRRTTYAELEEQVDRVARGLSQRVAPGNAIALYMPMTLECVVAYLGAVRAGCPVVSIADSFPSAEISKRLEIAPVEAIVTVRDSVRAGKRVTLYAKVVEADAPPAVVVGDKAGLRQGDVPWDEFLGIGGAFESVPSAPESSIQVLFSSGTTGTPKAIPWTHLTPIKAAMDGHFHQDIHADDVVCWPTNIGWMMGPWLIFATLINGATLALFEGAPTSAQFAGFVRDARVSILGTVPSIVRAWRHTGATDGVDWDGVRLFSSTGEASNADDMAWLMRVPGRGAPVIEYCGGTEIGGGYATSTVLQPNLPAAFSSLALGIDAVVLGESGEPVAEGSDGELFLIPPSIGLSQALLNRDHHREYYSGCPRGPCGEVLRRHGDRMVRLPGGYLRAAGRADDAMNLGGIKVSSLEIEQAVGRHPDVAECAAVGVPRRGGGSEELVVFAVVRRPVDGDALAGEVRGRIAAELNPLFRLRELVVIGELPRTASGKVMRRTLRDDYAKGADGDS